MEVSLTLTVLFQETFWVGILEKSYGEKYEVSKVVFGAEPKDTEVYEYFLKNFNNFKFSSPLHINKGEKQKLKKLSPKRLKRKIKKETEEIGIGTKAQLTMKLQQEINKSERKKHSKEELEKEKKRKFQLKQQKKLQKHLGH